MTLPTTAAEAILANALGYASASVNGTSVTAKTADDLIKLRRELAAIDAEAVDADTFAGSGFGLRFAQIQPPGGG